MELILPLLRIVRRKPIKVGSILIYSASAIFLLHLFFKTYSEPIAVGDGTKIIFSYGYQSTAGTFFIAIVYLPIMLFGIALQILFGDSHQAYLLFKMWLDSAIFGIGNILLVAPYLVRKKLMEMSYRKKYIALTFLCTMYAFFSANYLDFYFGNLLWLMAFIVLLLGLVLLNDKQDEKT